MQGVKTESPCMHEEGKRNVLGVQIDAIDYNEYAASCHDARLD